MLAGMFGAAAQPVSGGGGTDPYFANVVSLLHFDGADGSTDFTDVTGRVWTPTNSPTISTSNSLFGGASLALDDGDRLSTSGSVDFQFGTGDFTIEGWFRQTKAGSGFGTNFFLDIGLNNANGIGSSLSDSGQLEVRTSSGNRITQNITAGAIYLSICGVGGNTLYIGANGVVTSTAFSYNVTHSGTVYLGYGAPFGFGGNIDEFRITKGVARYTSNYATPTAPHPDS